MHMRTPICAVLAVPAILLSASAAIAATATGIFNVQVTIQETCIISGTTAALDFGTQTLLNADVDASTTISVQCSNGTDYDVTLDQGANSSRRMRLPSTSHYVDYELYTDAARTTVWPASVSAGPVYPYTGNGDVQSIEVYGRIPAQTTPAASATAYTDTVGITITY
jgi:spore coat protein U-like protein